MNPHPTRRAVVLAGAAAALAPALPAFAATPLRSKAVQPHASYWYPDSLPSGSPGEGITWAQPEVVAEGHRRRPGVQCAYYVPGLVREQGEKAARFEVRAIGELYAASGPAPAAHTW
ncbi:hypothetical protein [Streptomyces violascens]